MENYLIECTASQIPKVMARLRHSWADRDLYVSQGYPNVIVADISAKESSELADVATLYADCRLEPFPDPAGVDAGTTGSEDNTWKHRTLQDVLQHVSAPAAWEWSAGDGVTIALIDGGVPSTVDFPRWKRAGGSISFAYAGKAWHDDAGHGAMTACVAAATSLCGGKFNGVAPHAKILACRTSYRTNDVFMILDRLIKRISSQELKGPVVLNVSLGSGGQQPPTFGRKHPYVAAIERLISMGVFVACAAGNNHPADAAPASDVPNTIWGPNSLDSVCCVGAVDWNNRNDQGIHAKSSRGPGQWAGANPKPDCVAASYGEVLWGPAYRALKWWGTSGAAPQVAGLAALVLSYTRGGLSPKDVRDAILDGCKSLAASPVRVGRGLIDCAQTMRSL